MPSSLGDVIRVEAHFTLFGSVVMNVYHFVVETLVSGADEDVRDDLLAIIDGAHAALETSQSNALVATQVKIVNLDSQQVIAQVPWPNHPGGTNTADSEPPGVAYVVSFPTVTLGHRARKFLPGVPEDGVTNGLIVSGSMTSLENYADRIYDAMTYVPAAVNQYYAAAVQFFSFDPLQYTARRIVGYSVSNIPGYQRRRKQGVGI